MNQVEFFNETNEKVDEFNCLPNLISFAIEHENLSHLVFNVILVDDVYIHRLNLEYRHIDRPTDVITFALEDYEDIIYEDMRVLGDIYISIDRAREQAISYGHSLKRELSFLAIHGFLHLLGYDHMNKEDEKVMFEKQELILNEFGIKR